MKVLSLLQPWATLVVIGAKKIETRSWNTKYRGELLIHASARKPKNVDSMVLDGMEFLNQFIPDVFALPYGAIIGKVNLDEVKATTLFRSHHLNALELHERLTEQEYHFGDYSMNRYGWLLSDPVQFAHPIPAKGALQIWEYDMPELKTP